MHQRYVHVHAYTVCTDRHICASIKPMQRGWLIPSIVLISFLMAARLNRGWLRISDLTATLDVGFAVVCPTRHTAKAPLHKAQLVSMVRS